MPLDFKQIIAVSRWNERPAIRSQAQPYFKSQVWLTLALALRINPVMPFASSYQPSPQFIDLGAEFFDPVQAAPFPQHLLRFRNQPWAERMGLGALTADEWKKYFAHFEALPDNLNQPLALRYHGHQFRSYNPHLGDGRGFLFAQLIDPLNNRLLDLGTKGSGQTPWSRQGDGRLTLKGAVRETLATEMLEAQGVYTSKTLSVFETGEALERHDEPSPTRSGILVRLSHSHVRFGTFQRFAFQGEKERIQQLLDYSIQNYFPHLQTLQGPERVVGFVREVSDRSARLVASWMMAGFVHGVLNTDNMNITGESFDYGPYRFLPTYDPEFTAAYFDHSGLYAYGRQPESVLWNLERLAECLTLLVDVKLLVEVLETFPAEFNRASHPQFLQRLGLPSQGAEADQQLMNTTFQFLAQSQIGFEQFFFDAFGGFDRFKEKAQSSQGAEKYQGKTFLDFEALFKGFRPTNLGVQQSRNDYFKGEAPCTLLIDEIEAIWAAIDQNDDWSPFHKKIEAIRSMGQAYDRSSAKSLATAP